MTRAPAHAARRAAHLTARFAGSLRPRAVSPAERAWVASVLTRAELPVWSACARVDQVESIAVARRLPSDIAADDHWVAAALLHDVGKQVAALGTFGRVAATARAALGRFRADHEPTRMGQYRAHAGIGADLLARAGARPEAVAWAAIHHDPQRWPDPLIPVDVCVALARADGETVPGPG